MTSGEPIAKGIWDGNRLDLEKAMGIFARNKFQSQVPSGQHAATFA